MDATATTTRRKAEAPHPLFILGLAAVGLSVVVFTAIIVAAAGGGDAGGTDPFMSALIGTATPRPEDGTSPTATPTTAPGETPSPEGQSGESEPGSEQSPPADGDQGSNGDSQNGDDNGDDNGDGSSEGNDDEQVTGQGQEDEEEPFVDNSIVVACGDPYAQLDKGHRLPEDCVPGNLVSLPASVSTGGQLMTAPAAAALEELVAAAAEDGFEIVAVSAYRSFQDQVYTYDSNVQQFGQDYADRTSARPGHSEHQLGTTVDVSSPSADYGLESFIGTPEADWIAANAGAFGFSVSYKAGAEEVTGYDYEPWHIRWRP